MVGKVKEWNAAAVLGSWLGCRGEGPKRKLLTSIALVGCRKIMDASISALAHGCPLLSTIYLSYFDKISDTGVSALAHGCPKLGSTNLTTKGMVALVAESTILP